MYPWWACGPIPGRPALVGGGPAEGTTEIAVLRRGMSRHRESCFGGLSEDTDGDRQTFHRTSCIDFMGDCNVSGVVDDSLLSTAEDADRRPLGSRLSYPRYVAAHRWSRTPRHTSLLQLTQSHTAAAMQPIVPMVPYFRCSGANLAADRAHRCK